MRRWCATAPIAIVTLNLDGRIVAANPAFERLFGYLETEALGQELDELIAPPDLQSEMRLLTEQVETGETVHEVTRRQNRDGASLDVEVFGLPVVLWGKQIGMLALYHDIAAFTPAVPAGLPVAGEPRQYW